MPAGSGVFDAQGVWIAGEDDAIDALFSDWHNKGAESISLAIRARTPFPAATSAARDAYWGVPVGSGPQLALQGARTIRTDLGYTERYYALYDAGTNPGGAASVGWYPEPGTNIITRLATTANYVFPVAATDSDVPFQSAPHFWTAMWAIGTPSRIVLPVLGDWEIEAAGNTLVADGKVLRTHIAKNNVAVENSRDHRAGTAGVVDPFVRPRAIVNVTALTDYVQFRVQVSSIAGAPYFVAASLVLSARYLGPHRG